MGGLIISGRDKEILDAGFAKDRKDLEKRVKTLEEKVKYLEKIVERGKMNLYTCGHEEV